MRSASRVCRRLAAPAAAWSSLLHTPHTPSRTFSTAAFRHSVPCWCRSSSLASGLSPSPGDPGTVSSSSPAAPSASASAGRGNFFAFFGFEPSPELDASALQKRYHNLQRCVHPDQQNVQAKAEAARASSDQPPSDNTHDGLPSNTDTSVYGNVAYETLRDPYARCRYLLRLTEAHQLNKGEPLSPQQEEALMAEDESEIAKYRGLFNDQPLSDDFLMEMLAMNELIFAGDREDEAVRRQMQVLKADLEERDEDYHAQIRAHWEAQDISKYRQTMMEWTYISNALRHLKDRL